MWFIIKGNQKYKAINYRVEGDYSQDHKIGFLDNYRIENVACQFVELMK